MSTVKRIFPLPLNADQKSRRSKTRRRRLKATALAIGLATAWGGEANADVIVHLEVTPTRTLRDAYVYYTNNQSSANYFSLGALPENQTSSFNHLLDGEFENEPEKLLPTFNNPNVGYWVIGVFDKEDTPGVSVSFREATVVPTGTPWEDIFTVDEQHVANLFSLPFDDQFGVFIYRYGDPLYNPDAILPTHYGAYSTLVNFSDAEYGGTAIATIVPEPSSIILVGAAGVILLGGAYRRRVNCPCN